MRSGASRDQLQKNRRSGSYATRFFSTSFDMDGFDL